MNPRPALVALLLVAIFAFVVSGCTALEGAACPPGMSYRNGACEGFGDGFVWRRERPRIWLPGQV